MPIDPEVAAEIAAVKKQLLKLEQDQAGLSTGELAGVKSQILALEKSLADLLGKISKPPIDPAKPPVAPAKDMVASFLDGD